MDRRTMMTRTLAALAGLVGAVAGCGEAAMIRRSPSGGVLALRGAESFAMDDARQKMRAHCGGRYEITEEEVVTVGQRQNTYAYLQPSKQKDGGFNTGQFATTENVEEKRITYRCVEEQAEAAPAPKAGSRGTRAALAVASEEAAVSDDEPAPLPKVSARAKKHRRPVRREED